MHGACWVCFCCCTLAYALLQEFLGKGVRWLRTVVNSKGKIPSTGGWEENRTPDAVLGRIARPTHYRLSYSGPEVSNQTWYLTKWQYTATQPTSSTTDPTMSVVWQKRCQRTNSSRHWYDSAWNWTLGPCTWGRQPRWMNMSDDVNLCHAHMDQWCFA